MKLLNLGWHGWWHALQDICDHYGQPGFFEGDALTDIMRTMDSGIRGLERE